MDYITPSEISKDYYSFKEYNSKPRILTYWHQINECIKLRPKSILEIGIGTGLVTSYLRHCGIAIKTADINIRLEPDFVMSIIDDIDLDILGKYDLVICSRVLHHINFDDLDKALSNLSMLSKEHVLLTLPVDELRMYLMTRYTSSEIKTFSIKVPLFLKRILGRVLKRKLGSGLWQINSNKESSMRKVLDVIERYFIILNKYQMPEDSSHMLFVLKNK